MLSPPGTIPEARWPYRLSCGHLIIFSRPVPSIGDWVICLRCASGAYITSKAPLAVLEGGA